MSNWSAYVFSLLNNSHNNFATSGLLQSGKVRGKGSFSHWSGKVREFCEKSWKDFKKSGKFF